MTSLEDVEVASGTQHRKPVGILDYFATALIVLTCGLVGWLSRTFELTESSIVMIFLAGVAVAAARFGYGPAVAATLFGVLAFDFFFVPPFFSFAPGHTGYFATFGVMLGIGLLISELTSRLVSQLRASQHRERRTAHLYRLTRELNELAQTELLIETAVRELTDIFSGEVLLFLRQSNRLVQSPCGVVTSAADLATNLAAAQWVAENHRPAGLGTNAHSEATAFLVPMIGSESTVGVLGVVPRDARRFLNLEERRMLETCSNVIALSIERNQAHLEAHQAQIQIHSEQIRNSLLSSVSHDLRTPLAMISVTAASLLEESTEATWPEKREMLQTIVDEAHRLSRQVVNLLGIARLDSGPLVLDREWHVLEELIGVALNGLRRELQSHIVRVNIDDEFPLLWIAGELMQQVLANLLENAARYTPPGSVIEISAVALRDRVEIAVADNGPGLPSGGESKVFDRFFRGTTKIADGQVGIGLGLSICRGIVHAHGGQIRAANRPNGGAEFAFTIPCAQQKFELASKTDHAAMA